MTTKVLYKDGITHEVATQLDYNHYKKLGYVDVAVNGKNLVEEPEGSPTNLEPASTPAGESGTQTTEDISEADLKIIQRFKKISKVGDLDAFAQKLGDKVSKPVEEAFMARRIELVNASNKEGQG
jgi:hypothetical protein